ncbi:hypothetical protein MNBD_UNCLBAC01-1471 [hydrothermal vent metagenome]|uniref:Nucleotidyl transferase AbiEii/AbiGii toxin family protein n=1 Tax=hydrothermal vent metagenome TaxID=652676 RepID=A0A3B1D278_9ZZZZ
MKLYIVYNTAYMVYIYHMRKINFKIQKKILHALAHEMDDFYLVGGTALSMVYFNHRESYDLDFFTKTFSKKRVVQIMENLQENLKIKAELIGEQTNKKMINMIVYMFQFSDKSLCKIDFVEDFVKRISSLRNVDGINVLSLEDIYLRKIFAVAGHVKAQDTTGKDIMAGGRQESKDFYDLYCLSNIVTPLSQFVSQLNEPTLKEGVIHWYRTYDRMLMRTGLLDLVTNKKIDVRLMEAHFQKEIEALILEDIDEG